MEASGQYDAPAALRPGKNPGTRRRGGSVGTRHDLEVLEKRNISDPLPGYEPRTVQPAVSQYN